MNIFCLSTGRCGSTTFTKSFSHALNYTSGHETHKRLVGNQRFAYPDNHIESDNRLSWMLGSLDRFYGDAPIYVYLSRDTEQVIQSFTKRYSLNNIAGIMHGFGHGILQQPKKYEDENLAKLAEMYVGVVTDNIESFLKDKTKVVRFDVDKPRDSIHKIWEMGKIEGDVQKAVDEWNIKYNQS